MSFPLDTTGLAPTNLVVNEAQTTQSIYSSGYANAFMANGPFYAGGFSVSYTPTDGAAVPLVLGADYFLIYQMPGLQADGTNLVYGGIQLSSTTLNGTLSFTYQALGGSWSIDVGQIYLYLEKNYLNSNVVFAAMVPNPNFYTAASQINTSTYENITASLSLVPIIHLGIEYLPMSMLGGTASSSSSVALPANAAEEDGGNLQSTAQNTGQMKIGIGTQTDPAWNAETGGAGSAVAILKTVAVNSQEVATVAALGTGIWSYRSGVADTVVVPSGVRVLQISATADATAGSFTINGGDTITIPPYRSMTLEPKGNLVAPTIIFTGTTAYFVEQVQ